MHKLIFFLLIITGLCGKAQDLVILHTNDIHSHLMGFSPETEYTPLVNNNDSTHGGFARIAGYIKTEQAKHKDKLLTLDAGDFLMGTLFQTIETSDGFQLNLMHKTGYDYLALGNHEFDYGPGALAHIITNSKQNGPVPKILCTNYNKSESQHANELNKLFNDSTIMPFDIIEKNGYRIGIFSLMGDNAEEYIPELYNVEFENKNKTARKTARHLKTQEEADLVIALSHSGVSLDKNGHWQGEDVRLGKRNNNIDIIISGHSHTPLKTAVQAGNTLVVQAGASGIYIGRIEVRFDSFGNPLVQYKLVEMNDEIIADKSTQQKIEAQIPKIEQKILTPFGIGFNTPVLETSFDLTLNRNNPEESNLGPFVTDAIYAWLNRDDGPGTDVVVAGTGVIRNNILKGKHGKQNINDIFNIMPLGLGFDSIPGTPLAKIYLTGHELKKVMELILSVSDTRKSFYLFIKGMRIFADLDKGIFRKIKSIELHKEDSGYTPIKLNRKDKTLYSITANAYMVSFIGQLKKMSLGLVNVEPKDSAGNVKNSIDMVIDLKPGQEGIQEAKEWMSIFHYASGLEDTNYNGIPDIPEKYRDARNPIIPVSK